MSLIRVRGARVDIEVAAGSDLPLAFTVTDEAGPYDWAGHTASSTIVDLAGVDTGETLTVGISTTGTLALTLEAGTLPVGAYSYQVTITVGGVSRCWLAGRLTVVAATLGAPSATATTITVATGDAGTITLVSGGGGGVTDHGALTGLADDDHTHYLTTARHTAITGNPHSTTAVQVGADPAGTAAAAVVGLLVANNNLSDVADVATARTSLGLGTAATQAATAFDAAGSATTAQVAAIATSAASLTAHDTDTTAVHGIADTAALETVTGSAAKVTAHSAATDPHGDRAFATAAVAALSTTYQPLDGDLTAIAALSTTSFGRALLAIADATAGRSALELGAMALQPAPDVQLFTASGTWTKPAGPYTRFRACVVGGGAGGGSGRKSAGGAGAAGGAGGGAGGAVIVDGEFADLTATLTVTIGAGGAGGASVTANSTHGLAGSAGGASTVVGGVHVISWYAGGGNATGAATTTSGGGGGGGVGNFSGGQGGSGTVNIGSVGAYGVTVAGASGGGITTGGAASNGVSGRSSAQLGGPNVAATVGTAGGAVNGAAAASVPLIVWPLGGRSGGSGASSTTGNGGNGGAGSGYGIGGAGGGAALDSVGNSGAGAPGTPGGVLIICY